MTSLKFLKASKTCFNEVAQWPSEQWSWKVNLFYLNANLSSPHHYPYPHPYSLRKLMEICSENYCSVSSEWIRVKKDWALVDWQRWLENHALSNYCTLYHIIMWRWQFYYLIILVKAITLLLYQWEYIISTDWYTCRFKKTQSLTNQSWLSSTLTHPIQEPNWGLWMSCSDNIFNNTFIKMLKNDDHDGVYDWTALFFKKKCTLFEFQCIYVTKVLYGDTVF